MIPDGKIDIRALAAANPEAFIRDLAVSLGTLANTLSDLDQHEKAAIVARTMFTVGS